MKTDSRKKKSWLRRWIIRAVLLIVVLVVAALLFVDSIIKTTVNTMAPKIAGVPVVLEGVSVHPLEGAVYLEGLVVSNPDGYTQAVPLLSAGVVDIDISLLSLPTSTWVLERLVLDSPQFCYESKGGILGVGGKNNLQALLDNIQKNLASSDSPAKDAQTADSSVERKFILKLVKISNVQVDVVIGGNATRVTIPDIEIKDIGVKEGGVSGAVAGGKIMTQVLTQIATASAKAVADGALKAGGNAVDGAANALKGLFTK